MANASTRILRIVLGLWAALGAYLVSPLSRLLPVVTVAAAESEGLGAGGVSFALNFVYVVSVILAFIFGFAIRDFIHRRGMRAKNRKRAAATPPRA